MFKSIKIGTMLILFFTGILVFAEDEAISISSTYVFFTEQTPGEQSDAVTVTLTNKSYVSGIAIGSVGMNGPHSANFLLSADSCSGQSIAETASCTLQVKFAPQSSGNKSALISIPYGTGDANLSVYLSNKEDAAHEVERRLSPSVYDLNISEEMNAGDSYDLNWTAMGYHDGYKAMVVMFDCTDMDPGTCGAAYDSAEKFHESALLIPVETTSGDWGYKGETAQNFHYTYPYTIPATRPANSTVWPDTGTPVVIRFYIRSTEDSALDKPRLSLIIPGNLSDNYYDTSGRKIQKIICPSGGCATP